MNAKTGECLNVGDTVRITTLRGIDARVELGTVLSQLHTGQYTVETESGNRYLRYLDEDGNETGVDKIKALLMSATDAELMECKDFINSQMLMMHGSL